MSSWKASAQVDCWREGAWPECDDGDPTDGYWWNGTWVPGLPDYDTWFRPAPLLSYGKAVWYGPNVMEGTARWRRLDLDGYADGVALMSCADVGETVWTWVMGYGFDGPFLVVDCAQRDDIWPIIAARQEVIEVGWETKKRWGMDQPWYPVFVFKAETGWDLWRLLETHREPIDYPAWWLERATFAEDPRPYRYCPGPERVWRIGTEWVQFLSPGVRIPAESYCP